MFVCVCVCVCVHVCVCVCVCVCVSLSQGEQPTNPEMDDGTQLHRLQPIGAVLRDKVCLRDWWKKKGNKIFDLRNLNSYTTNLLLYIPTSENRLSDVCRNLIPIVCACTCVCVYSVCIISKSTK